jgi:predicted metalloprotease with PDZ domain
MSKLLTIFLLLPFLLKANDPLTYTIKPITIDGRPRLQVTVSFDGDLKGTSFLAYQDNQFGEPNQLDFLNIPMQLPGVKLSKEPDSNRLVVRHAPGARVQVVYEVLDLLEASKKPFHLYCCNMPIIDTGYFHVQTGHLLAVPSHYWSGPEAVETVTLHWEKFPANWMLQNSFGPDNDQTIRLTSKQFETGVFVGGDFRRHRFEVQGSPVYFVTRGKWNSFSDDTLTQLLRRTVEGHRAFWKDYTDTIYTVTFLPVEGAPYSEKDHFVSTGGSGLTNSFMSYATNNAGVQYDRIRYIYVHELMHRWIGTKIENAKEEQQYWFSEGFTEYYTLKNSLRYGFISAEEFIRELNDDFATPHYASPKRLMPNDSLNYQNFWNGGKEWEKLPYRRGCLYAFYLDNLIRESSKGDKSLDDFMRQLLTDITANPNQKLDHPFFLKTLQPFLGKGAKKDFKRFIEAGELINFQKTLLPAGLTVEVRDVTMRYGTSPENITSTVVYKNSPVFKRAANVSFEAIRVALLR